MTLPDSPEAVPVFYQQGERAATCRYPFGFGLSYTEFGYSDLSVPAQVALDSEEFTVGVTVTNRGRRSGAEIIQIYRSSESEPKQLIGFARVELEPKESCRIRAAFPMEMFSEYDAQGRLHLRPQHVVLQVGASSVDIRLRADVDLVGEQRELTERRRFLPAFEIDRILGGTKQ